MAARRKAMKSGQRYAPTRPGPIGEGVGKEARRRSAQEIVLASGIKARVLRKVGGFRIARADDGSFVTVNESGSLTQIRGTKREATMMAVERRRLQRGGDPTNSLSARQALRAAQELSAEANRKGTWAAHRDAQDQHERARDLRTHGTMNKADRARAAYHDNKARYHAQKMVEAPDHPVNLKAPIASKHPDFKAALSGDVAAARRVMTQGTGGLRERLGGVTHTVTSADYREYELARSAALVHESRITDKSSIGDIQKAETAHLKAANAARAVGNPHAMDTHRARARDLGRQADAKATAELNAKTSAKSAKSKFMTAEERRALSQQERKGYATDTERYAKLAAKADAAGNTFHGDMYRAKVKELDVISRAGEATRRANELGTLEAHKAAAQAHASAASEFVKRGDRSGSTAHSFLAAQHTNKVAELDLARRKGAATVSDKPLQATIGRGAGNKAVTAPATEVIDAEGRVHKIGADWRKINVTQTASGLIGLDDPQMAKEMGLILGPTSKKGMTVYGSPKALAELADTARQLRNDPDWDMPVSRMVTHNALSGLEREIGKQISMPTTTGFKAGTNKAQVALGKPETRVSAPSAAVKETYEKLQANMADRVKPTQSAVNAAQLDPAPMNTAAAKSAAANAKPSLPAHSNAAKAHEAAAAHARLQGDEETALKHDELAEKHRHQARLHSATIQRLRKKKQDEEGRGQKHDPKTGRFVDT